MRSTLTIDDLGLWWDLRRAVRFTSSQVSVLSDSHPSLEILEDRLKNDVVAEVNAFQGR
jgi:hypothetical protein